MELTREEIVSRLNETNPEKIKDLIQKAYELKVKVLGKNVYFRGLIELSNRCAKDCFYCGIRKSNSEVHRYELTEEEAVEAGLFAYKNGYGSVVIQSGEQINPDYLNRICNILKRIKRETYGKIGITLSVGEQSEKTYQRFFECGAHRYLLRIETSRQGLYERLHPQDHSFSERLKCLSTLKSIGYQVGTGVMIGLPFQTTEDLADDLLFFVRQDIDMVGMGPYLEHPATPLYQFKDSLWSLEKRFEMTLKMIALLRILVPDMNIAATTALQTLEYNGRERGLLAGANVIMPNLTPEKYRGDYLLYEGKPCLNENPRMCAGCLEKRIQGIGEQIAYHEWGDPAHFKNRQARKQ